MKVCFISHSAGQRGAEGALIEAVIALRQIGVEVLVFVPGPGPLTERLEAEEIEVDRFWGVPWVTTRPKLARRWLKLIAMGWATVKLVAKLRRAKCDVVYSNTIAVPTGALAAGLLGRPHVWHFHEFGLEDHGFVFDTGLEVAKRVIRRYGGHLVFNSESVRSKWLDLLAGPVYPITSDVVYQSVVLPGSADSASNRSSSTPSLVLVGALHPNKGQTDALMAVQELAARNQKCSLTLVGDGPDRSRLERLACDLEIEQQVTFAGEVDNVRDWYAAADVVLVCSRFEAFGRVAVEGMLSNKPVIAAASGGLVEIVTDGESGLLYSPGDHVVLADKIEFLLSHPEASAQLAVKGRTVARTRFTPEHYGEELYRVLKRVDAKGNA